MNTSSLAKPATCPAWCTTDHTEDFASSDGPDDIVHDAVINSSFVACMTPGDDLGTTAILSEIDDNTDLGPQQLRQLAADALAAAEWIEANR